MAISTTLHRWLKRVIQTNAGLSEAEGILNAISGLSGGTVTATAAELNALDGITSTVDELNTVDLTAVGAILKVKKIAIAATPTGSEQSTAWALPAKAGVLDVFLDVTTAEETGATKTMDVGTLTADSGDPDGYIDGISVATTGLKRAAFVQTTGANNSYVGAAATHTIGALLTGLLIAGQDVASAGDGVAVKGLDVASGAKNISYTAGGADWAEFRGDIYVVYIELG